MKSTFFTGYWTFFCNPKLWAIDDFLKCTEENTVSKYFINRLHRKHFQAGQLGLIRVGNDTRTKQQLLDKKRLKRGIYAVVEIVSEPSIIRGVHDTNWLDSKSQNYDRALVAIKYLKIMLDNPILLDTIKSDQIINCDKFLINGFQSATMPLLPTAFDQVLSYIAVD